MMLSEQAPSNHLLTHGVRLNPWSSGCRGLPGRVGRVLGPSRKLPERPPCSLSIPHTPLVLPDHPQHFQPLQKNASRRNRPQKN